MRIDKLVRIVEKRRLRRGQGRGSGSGHTSGRGNKGQKARGKVGILFEGTKGKKALVRRLPFWRGKGRMKRRGKPVTVRVDRLARFEEGKRVDVEGLIKMKIVDERAKELGVKVVGGGKLVKKLVIAVPTSSGAEKEVRAAGGTIEKRP